MIFSYPFLHSAFLLGGPRRNIAIPFGMEKLEWWGYQMVKKIEDIYIYIITVYTQYWRVTDRQTDRQRDILRRHSPRYAYASRGKNDARTGLRLQRLRAWWLFTPCWGHLRNERSTAGRVRTVLHSVTLCVCISVPSDIHYRRRATLVVWCAMHCIFSCSMFVDYRQLWFKLAAAVWSTLLNW